MTLAIDYTGMQTMPRGIAMLTDTRMVAVSEDLVLFDIGGVQLELDYKKFFEEAARLAWKSPEQFMGEYVNSGIETRVMTRSEETAAAEYFDGLRKIIGRDLPESELARLIGYAWKGQVDEVLEVKDRVMDAGYLVANFSNISEMARLVIDRAYPRIFESDEKSHRGIYSYEVGDIKPSEAMYNAAAELGFDNITLVDDNEAYVREGAEKFGWNGILFTPYIDKAEPVRAAQQYRSSSARIEVANSPAQLVFALKRFGVEI